MTDPVFVYDDDCGFCTWWAAFFAARADVRVVGFSALDPALRGRLPETYTDCSHFVTDWTVRSCGASVEAAMLRTRPGSLVRPLVVRLREVGAYRAAREWAYRRVANSRGRLGRIVSKSPPAGGTE